MNPVSSHRIKLLLALFIVFLVVAETAAQTLRKIELNGSKPPARSGHTLINVGGNVILLGGNDGSFATSAIEVASQIVPQGSFNDVWQFNRESLEFNLMREINQKPKSPKLANRVAHDGKIVELFGIDEGVGFNSEALTFEPISTRWEIFPTAGDSACKNRTEVNLVGSAIVSNDKPIYAVGGLGPTSGMGSNFVKTNCMLNPRNGIWSQLKQMAFGVVTAAIALSISDDRFYVVGGRGETGLSDKVQEYDTKKDEWRVVSGAPGTEGEITPQANEALIKRSNSAYVQAGNSLYLFGGRGENFQRLDDVIKVEFKADNTFTVRKLDVKFPAGFDSSSAALISLTPATGITPSDAQATSPHTAEILIFGGTVNPNNVTNDTFIFTDTVEAMPPPADECTGGPAVTGITIGGKMKIKGNGFLEGLRVTLNGIGFNKLPVVENKVVVQKGFLTNGLSILESCAAGCEVKINNGDGKCTKVAATP